MKKLFGIIATCLFSAGALATPTGIWITQNAGDGSGPYSYEIFCTPPANCIWTYNNVISGTQAPRADWAVFSSPFVFTSGSPSTLTFDLAYFTANASTIKTNLGITAPAARSFNYTTRALNSCFQPSATRDVQVSYAVDISTSLSLVAGQQGTVYLETFTNSSCTTGSQEVTRFVNGQTGTLTIGLALTQNVTGTLTGIIPAGVWVKLRTENNTGTPTFTARPGQEVLL